MIVYINSTCSSTDAYKLNYIPSKETPLEFIPEVPISEYALEFHDGELLEIKQNQDNISLTMSSAEIRPDFLIKDASLFNNGRIKGTLHFETVLFLTVNRKVVSELKWKQSGRYFLYKIFQ